MTLKYHYYIASLSLNELLCIVLWHGWYLDQFGLSSYLTLDRRRWGYPCPEMEILVQVARNPECADVQETKYHETSPWRPTWPYPTLICGYLLVSVDLFLAASTVCAPLPLCVVLPATSTKQWMERLYMTLWGKFKWMSSSTGWESVGVS